MAKSYVPHWCAESSISIRAGSIHAEIERTRRQEDPMSVIYILTTGGTIEKTYSESDGSVLNAENKLERYLARLRRPGVETYVVPVMNKDSLEMHAEDRTLLFGIVKGLLAESAP